MSEKTIDYEQEGFSGDELRLLKFYDHPSLIEDSDFTLLQHVEKEIPIYDKGRKIESAYHCDLSSALLVKKRFEDVLIDGKLDRIKMYLDFYCFDGTIGHTKEMTAIKFSIETAKQHYQKRRSRIISYMEGTAEGTPIDAAVKALYDFYDAKIQKYINRGSKDLKNAVNSETDPTISAILGTVYNTVTGDTIKDMVLFNISNWESVL